MLFNLTRIVFNQDTADWIQGAFLALQVWAFQPLLKVGNFLTFKFRAMKRPNSIQEIKESLGTRDAIDQLLDMMGVLTKDLSVFNEDDLSKKQFILRLIIDDLLDDDCSDMLVESSNPKNPTLVGCC